MKVYKVRITERLEREISVEAASAADARKEISRAWRAGEIVLDANDFSFTTLSVNGGPECEL